jgi:hypothetical protein
MEIIKNKEPSMINETYTIPAFNKIDLELRIKKFNKRAKKLNVNPLKISFDNEQMFPMSIDVGKDSFGHPISKEIQVKHIDATVDYEIPIIEGWELISNFDANQDSDGNIVVFTSTVPNKELPEKFMEKSEIHCDHCGHIRFRKKSFLLRNVESNEYKEVGSTCIKDFFGWNPKGFLFAATWNYPGMFSFDMPKDLDSFRSYGYDTGVDFDKFMTMTSAVIRKHGWVSRALAKQKDLVSTACEVGHQLFEKPKEKHKISPDDNDKKIAAATIAWFTELDAGNNDYFHNCKKVVKLSFVPFKMEGVAASMIQTYNRETFRGEEKVRLKAENKESDFFGKLNDRIKGLVVKVVYKQHIESDFGISTLYIFVNEETGNKFKTFYSGSKWELGKNDMVVITGTIKKHDEYKGEKSTMLNRVVVTETLAMGI